MPFERIEHKKRSVYAVEQIIKVIQDGLYKVGDKLPPERVIAEKTGKPYRAKIIADDEQ
ncbi:hypothetical protein M1N21_02445 [Dehalococcoidia bacterium]|nr:hypothetical protein [Dehalococcoidia bacterium]